MGFWLARGSRQPESGNAEEREEKGLLTKSFETLNAFVTNSPLAMNLPTGRARLSLA